MSLAGTYPPLVHTVGLERLDLIDWDEVHEAVQLVLAGLDKLVSDGLRSARAAPGRNSAPAWSLFSYRTLRNSDEPDIDPVVAGLTFEPGPDGSTAVTGDLSGETLGDVLFECPQRWAVGRLPILEAARDLAEQLVRNHAAVSTALRDRSRSA